MKKSSSRVGRPGRAVIVLCLVQFVDVLGITELIAAMPSILRALSAPEMAASLLVTAYAMCFGGLLMFGARLGDHHGHRVVLLGGIRGFAAGSLLAAVGSDVTTLVVGRCVQGASAAVSVPAALRLIIAATPDPRDRRRALSVWSASGAVAGAAGYVLGGALTEVAGWRAMFWINIPLAAGLGDAVVRQTRDRGTARDPNRLDLLGASLFTAAVMSAVLAGSELERPARATAGLLLLAAAVALSALFGWVERRASNPLVPTDARRQPRLRAGAAAAFLNTATTSPVIAIATLQLQRAEHLGALAAALRLMPFSLCVIAGAVAARPALDHASRRMVIGLGLGLIGAGDALLLVLGGSGWLLAGCVGISGAGIGLSSVAATSLGTDVGEMLQAAAAGALNTSAQLGTALGVAALLLLASASEHSGIPVHGSRLGWAAAAGMAFGGAVVAASGGRGLASRWQRSRVRPPPVDAA